MGLWKRRIKRSSSARFTKQIRSVYSKAAHPQTNTAPIGTILPKAVKAQSAEEITTLVHEEFVRWFGHDTAGPRHAYEAPAAKIWKGLLDFRKDA